MKKLIIFAVIVLVVISCKKVKTEPIGPTDIRIRNLVDSPMNFVMVNTYDTTINFGTINAQSYSDYHRFDRAYNAKVNISAYINGVRYKIDTVTATNYTHEVYLGQMKATYEVWLSENKLKLYKTVPDAPLK
jgi:hypothetical protein